LIKKQNKNISLEKFKVEFILIQKLCCFSKTEENLATNPDIIEIKSKKPNSEKLELQRTRLGSLSENRANVSIHSASRNFLLDDRLARFRVEQAIKNDDFGQEHLRQLSRISINTSATSSLRNSPVNDPENSIRQDQPIFSQKQINVLKAGTISSRSKTANRDSDSSSSTKPKFIGQPITILKPKEPQTSLPLGNLSPLAEEDKTPSTTNEIFPSY
jgi:hypothetical protein